MMHHVRRWNRDHAEELQSAWLNGIGVMVWEVVFGVWVGWYARDAATLRRMVAAQRALRAGSDRRRLDAAGPDLGRVGSAAGSSARRSTSPPSTSRTLINRTSDRGIVVRWR